LRRFWYGLALLTVSVGGVATALALPAFAAHSSAAKTVTINVTASEWKFKLSKTSVPTGTTVVFKVTNKGKIAHDFKIDGKKTQLIQPGATKSLKVVFKKKGTFVYLCTVTGHAKLGMQGKFGVGAKVVTTTTTTGGTTGGTTTTTANTCSTPTSTVHVGMVEYAFNLDQTSVPAGCIQFVITNNGTMVHNFDLQGKHLGALINPGDPADTWAVQLTPGTYQYLCDVGEHANFGMLGNLTVT